MNDEPQWSDANAIEALRDADDLKQGDVIQQWIHVRDAQYRVTWQWRDGDVLSIVEAPCENVRWVALIQWHDGENVKGWSALAQYEWRSVLVRRKP